VPQSLIEERLHSLLEFAQRQMWTLGAIKPYRTATFPLEGGGAQQSIEVKSNKAK